MSDAIQRILPFDLPTLPVRGVRARCRADLPAARWCCPPPLRRCRRRASAPARAPSERRRSGQIVNNCYGFAAAALLFHAQLGDDSAGHRFVGAALAAAFAVFYRPSATRTDLADAGRVDNPPLAHRHKYAAITVEWRGASICADEHTGRKPPKDLIGFLDFYFVKKAPFQIPDGGREFIVKFGPWITVVLLILTLPVLLFALGLGAIFIPFGGIGYASGFGVLTIFVVVEVGLMIAALPGLFARKMAGWRLLFYSQLISHRLQRPERKPRGRIAVRADCALHPLSGADRCTTNESHRREAGRQGLDSHARHARSEAEGGSGGSEDDSRGALPYGRRDRARTFRSGSCRGRVPHPRSREFRGSRGSRQEGQGIQDRRSRRGDRAAAVCVVTRARPGRTTCVMRAGTRSAESLAAMASWRSTTSSRRSGSTRSRGTPRRLACFSNRCRSSKRPSITRFCFSGGWTGGPRTAVVFGAGPIGLLGAAVMRTRGLDTHVVGREPATDRRAPLVKKMGATYHSVAEQDAVRREEGDAADRHRDRSDRRCGRGV